jgi:hypothetical protein
MTRTLIRISTLTASEIEALHDHGMYWCTGTDTCEADPLYSIVELPAPPETTEHVLAHLCHTHLRGHVSADRR